MLEQIEEIRELARTLNFNTAAQVLHMSQSTLTRHVAALEKRLGFRLFSRSPMGLTQAGQYYVTAVAKLAEEYNQIVETCSVMAKRDQESVCVNMVAATNSLWGDVIYEAITRMQDGYPNIPEPHLSIHKSMSIESSVFSGLADVGMVFREPVELPEGFACIKIAELPLAAYFKQTSPLAEFDQVSFSMLADYYLVCPSSPQLQTTFDGALDAFQRNNTTPRYRIRNFTDFDRVYYLLDEDEYVLGNNIPGLIDPTKTLVSRPVAGQANTYPVYLLFNTNSSKPATALFVDLCLEIAKKRFGTSV